MNPPPASAPDPAPEIVLRGTERQRVRRLQGFRRGGHREPDDHNPATEAFVRKIAADDLAERGEQLFQQLRQVYGWKRKELNYRLEPGLAVIETPAFTASITVEQDPTDARTAIFATEVRGYVTDAAEGVDDRFVALFGRSCDTVVIEFAGSLDLEERIDFAEEHPRLAALLEYPADASWMCLRLEQPPVTMRLEANRLDFSIPRGGDLRSLLEGSQSLLDLFADAGAALVPFSPGP